MPAPLIFAISGAAQLGLGAMQLAEANKRRRAAQAAYERSMQQYRAQDTSNLYANLENPYEDLTVNQQAAQFQAQEQQRGMADMMSRFQETSTGGDISAFAQVLANQQAQNLQRASASIAQQEAANQRMAAQGAMRIEGMERMGAERARAFKGNILGTELGMNMQTLAGAEAARNQAITNVAGGAGNLVAGGVGMYQNYKGKTVDMGDGVQFVNLPQMTMDNVNSGELTRTSGSGYFGTYTPQYDALGRKIDPVTGEIIE
jgi:hypothetical protein